MMKPCVILPAFNEAESLPRVLQEIKSLGMDISIIVVDDGSQDETASIAQKEGAHLLRHNKRRGKGAALRDGFNYAIKEGYDIIVLMDADGQHEASDIPKFIECNQETKAPVIIGNRMMRPTDMPRNRIFTNRLMSSIISAICHQKIPDTQCGFRLFTRQALESIELRARKFEIDSELLIKLSRKGHRIESIPIKSIYAEETSQIRPLRDTFRFLRFLFKIIINKE